MRYNSLFCAQKPLLLRALFVLGASVFVASFSVAGAFAAAPVYDGTVSPQKLNQALEADKSLAARLEKLERGNDAILQMLTRLDALQQDVRRLNGSSEEQAHRLETMKQRQHELYLDIDRRISKLEDAISRMNGSASAMPSNTPAPSANSNSRVMSLGQPAATTASTSAGPVGGASETLEMQAYDQAFNYLKTRKYALAIPSFQAFLESFPNAKYADKAQYWLGEANYIQRKYSDAIDEFSKFIKSYPKSSKLPDAKLKLGMAQKAVGDKKLAIEILQEVIDSYPKSTAARMAKKRLQVWKGG